MAKPETRRRAESAPKAKTTTRAAAKATTRVAATTATRGKAKAKRAPAKAKPAPAKRATTTAERATTTAKRAPSKAPLPEGGLLASIPRDHLWLMKSEPDVYGIDALERDGTTGWDGVRNFMARNFMKDEMEIGDLVLFYHSNAEPSGVAGLAKVAGPPRPDPTQFDRKSEYFDATSPKGDPRWILVEVAFVERFERVVSLDELKADRALDGMLVVRKGMRLSVQPVVRAHFERVLALAGARTKVPS